MSSQRGDGLAAVLAVGLGIIAVFAVAGYFLVTNPDSLPPQPITMTVTQPARTVTFTMTTTPPPLGHVEQARQVKPLQQLVPGDKVLYDAHEGRPVCTFTEWFGSIATARITCPGLGVLEVATGFLSPVEVVPVTTAAVLR